MDAHPFGHSSRLNPPLLENHARFLRGDVKPRLTAIIYGTYNVVYSWPPPARVLEKPQEMTLAEPCMLGATLFGCRCGPEIAERLQPVKVDYIERPSVNACELVNCESQVLEGLDRTMCACRQSPIGDKFVALPINEDILLFYQRRPNVVYTKEVPFTCFLLVKYLPSEAEIHAVIEGLEIAKRPGGITFRPRNEE
ncbi:uncharacterized protein [Choristoneura fumiferana]|uniref:uncharacterized protein n=1 Tax=Choristoneura fumiferana TaxID=7141 RepID=UPI003D1567D0